MRWNYQTEVLGPRLPCLWLETRGHFAILWFAAASVACCSNYWNHYRCIHSRLYGTSASCLVPRPSISLLLVRNSGRLLFTFHFMQPAICIVRMLCCMCFVASASKASMTVTLKSLKIKGLKRNIYNEATFSCLFRKLQRLTHDVCHIKIGSPSGNISNWHPYASPMTVCPLVWGCWGRFNPLNAELNPICCLLALLGAHHFLHVSRIRVKSLTFRLLLSYIQGVPGGMCQTSGGRSLC